MVPGPSANLESRVQQRTSGFDSRRLHHCMKSVSAVSASSKVECGSAPSSEEADPPHALFTAGGVWHPLDDLCCMEPYSGYYDNEMARSEWKAGVAEIVDRHLDQVVVCVD